MANSCAAVLDVKEHQFQRMLLLYLHVFEPRAIFVLWDLSSSEIDFMYVIFIFCFVVQVLRHHIDDGCSGLS